MKRPFFFDIQLTQKGNKRHGAAGTAKCERLTCMRIAPVILQTSCTTSVGQLITFSCYVSIIQTKVAGGGRGGPKFLLPKYVISLPRWWQINSDSLQNTLYGANSGGEEKERLAETEGGEGAKILSLIHI